MILGRGFGPSLASSRGSWYRTSNLALMRGARRPSPPCRGAAEWIRTTNLRCLRPAPLPNWDTTAWHSRRDSNPYLLIRSQVSYPLNDGSLVGKEGFEPPNHLGVNQALFR